MMKRYDVFGIGNAVVDIVFETNENFLLAHHVDKGVMTLVDEARQHELISSMQIDSSMMQCGGSAANTIIALSQFGGAGYYACKVANDEFGQFYLKDLKLNGVDTQLTAETASHGVTGKCLVMVTPDADRTMNTFLGITSNFSRAEIDEQTLCNARYLYIEGYLVTSETSLDAMKYAKSVAEKNGVKVALTFSDLAMVKYYGSQMKDVVGTGVDLLFCNEDEACSYTGKDSLPEACEQLKKIATKFAITRGKKSSIIYNGQHLLEVEAFPASAIDTVGAGDMFAGAFLYGITQGYSEADSARLANLSAARVVAQYGPRLTREQIKKLLGDWGM